MTDIPDSEVQSAINSLGQGSFSTYDFIIALKKIHPKTWQLLEKKYGRGGCGAGKAYSAYSRAAHVLSKYANAKHIARLDYRPAPEGWGSPVIRYWAFGDSPQHYPDDLDILESDSIIEGAKQSVVVNRYERSIAARLKCIKKWGVNCSACGFNFEKVYGQRGAGFIHVHHLKPISEIGESYELDPVNDLRPVCPNCHSMIHRTRPAISISELKKLIDGV